MDPVNLEMLKQAANAARDGDYDNARELVSSVLENDEENVRAWLMLARLSNDDNEKRMALTTVLNLDPGNERAKQLLDVLEKGAIDDKDDIIPGITRRQFQLMMGGLIGLVVILLIFVVTANNRQSAAERDSANTEAAFTQVALNAIALETDIAQRTAGAGTQAVVQITEAWLTEITATLTPTPTPTVTPTFTPTDTRPSALPPVQLPVTGIIAAWSQDSISASADLPLVTIDASRDGTRTFIGNLEGRFVSLSPDGQFIIYTTDTRGGDLMQLATIDGEERRFGATVLGGLGISAPRVGRFSPTGTQYAFTAQADNGTTEIFLMTLPDDLTQLQIPTAAPADQPTVTPPFSIVQMTLDDVGNYSSLSFSPDGSQILAVREDISDENPGFDLAIINIANRTRAVLTNDRNALAESHATWSPAGNLIVYSAIAEGDETHDLYLISADGTGQPIALTNSPADDIYPQYSPDGSYLAFSSNRAADYNIFLIDMSTQQVVAQLTDRDRPVFIGSWVDPGTIPES